MQAGANPLQPINNQHTETSRPQNPPGNLFQFPSTAQPMAPISGQTPQQRPPLANQTHSRSSSFFSFRNRQSPDNQNSGHLRTSSMSNGDSSGGAGAQLASQQSNVPQPRSPPASHTSPPSQHNPQRGSQQQPTRTNAASPLARTLSKQNAQPPPQPATATPSLHPEIRSVVQLTAAHAHKIYFSGPLVRRIERQPDGQRPAKDEGWSDVWAQLGGTTLSIWDMKQIQEASKLGKEVPPTYVNTTDAFVQVLGSVTVPATTNTPAKRYTDVLTLNTAGSNLLLFSCPSTVALMSWAAALRLSAWEKSRLEEIYTAHLIRITLSARDVPTTLIRGRMEGWVRIRIAGQTDWKRMWMVVTAGTESVGQVEQSSSAGGGIGSVPTPATPLPKKKRMSNLFSRDHSGQQASAPTKSMVSMYGSPKPKDRKRPLLTIKDVTQAFAVYPERPELISRSTLIKVEGLLGDEETAAAMKTREGWVLVMPELEGGLGQAAEMLKWVVALHDAFELYGRPEAWTWDPRDPNSLMFSYPVGPSKDLLFLDRELAETLDPRDDRTSAIRSRLIGILMERMRGHDPQLHPPRLSLDKPQLSNQSSDKAPSLPPIGGFDNEPQQNTSPDISQGGPQLPPLSFGGSASLPQEKKQLTPIAERVSGYTNGRTPPSDTSNTSRTPPRQTSPQGQYKPFPPAHEQPEVPVPDHPPMSSPPSASSRQPPVERQPYSPASNTEPVRSSETPSINQNSWNPPRFESNSQIPGSKSPRTPGTTSAPVPVNPANVQLPQSPVLESRPVFSSHTITSSLEASEPLSPSPRTSVLTSPHSTTGHDDRRPSGQFLDSGSDRASVLTSPHSIMTSPHSVMTSPHSMMTSPHSPQGIVRTVSLAETYSSSQSQLSNSLKYGSDLVPTSPRAPQSQHEPSNISSEAGALYYMQQYEPDGSHNQSSGRRVPTTIVEQDSSTSSLSYHESSQPSRPRVSSPTSGNSSKNDRPVRQNTPMAFVEQSSSTAALTISATNIPSDRPSPTSRPGLGRKPSGARAQATRSYGGDGISSSHQVTEEEETQSEDNDSPQNRMDQLQARPSVSSEDPNLDALAALSYLDADQDKPTSPKQARVEPLNIRPSNKVPSPPPALPPAAGAGTGAQFKSSFAPSKQAAERKAKAQAQQAAHHAAVHKPGRANGKRKSKIAGAWNESSEDEEDEDEDEDDDDDEVDSDGEPSLANKQTASSGRGSSNTSLRHIQNQNQAAESNADAQQAYSHLRPPRTLPQIPGNYSEEYNPPPRRMASDQYSEAGRRTYYDGTQIRTQAEFPQPGAARQSMWSQVLDPGRTPGALPDTQNTRDTFVQLEPAETMTKAFTPQGLLSAGIQDKQDRSAKRQEELARETGASLINVPNKPPPPQMGLLGAITAHERERKREGGVGAALTEREREKRVAEDRQRRFDDHQRQQLDQMQQGGSMYGGQFPGYNMMGNPMMMMNPMMGMSPMMTGTPMMTGGGMAPMMTGQMGYPGMMPGYNPQHMFAAQQAAQAYQQAMMAFSVAGSQVGGEGGAGPSQLNPTMTGGNMAGFDPRMSMMGMPMGAPQMGPMGMQMTGMSGFDPRFGPNMNSSPQSMNDPGLAPPTGLGGQGQGQFPSGNSSPVGRGSPLARPADTADRGRESSRPASPKS